MNYTNFTKFFLWVICALMPVSSTAQSLAEAARKENERRKSLEESGISGKVIEQHDATQLGLKGNLSVFVPPEGSRAERPAATIGHGALQSFRKRLQVLDREIREGDDRLALLNERIRTARRAPPVLRRSSRGSPKASSVERLQEDVREWELKLKRLRQDRLEAYNAARRAGFLPGELTGK